MVPIGCRLDRRFDRRFIRRLVADLVADFELNGFSLHVELMNIYRILDVWYVCGFHFYFTFHFF